MGLATKTQLFRLSLSPSRTCMSMADNVNGLYSDIAEPHDTHDVCGWRKARNVSGNQFALYSGDAVPMQCPLSIGSYLWTREADALARQYMGSGVKTILHAGTYSCRKQVGNGSGKWSEHAYANAWDVMGFALEDGRIISVKTGWNGTPEERKFLRAVRKKGCGIFRVTLSPDFNAAHHDHFHFDMGPTVSCK